MRDGVTTTSTKLQAQPLTNLASDGLPHCETCRDLRVVRVDAQPGQSQFGSLIPCPACGDQARAKRRGEILAYRQGQITHYSQHHGRAMRQTFATFDPRQEEGQTTATVRLALQKARSFAEDPAGWLVLTGTKGTGKSHLCAAITNAQGGRPTLFLNIPNLLDLLRAGYQNDSYQALLRLCQTIDVLVLDDLGVEKLSDWAYEKLYQILDHRYQAEMPTVIATNCRITDLEGRLADRLADNDLSQVFQILAPSWRQRKNHPGLVVQ